MTPKTFAAAAAFSLMMSLSGAVFAQTAPTAAATTPAAQQGLDPADPEVDLTRRLNAEVAAQDELAVNQERANDVEHAAEVDAYKEESADVDAENDRRVIDADINAQSRAEYEAEQQARYDHAMADWRATVEACRRGDRARCEAGKQPAIEEPVG